MAIVKQGNTTLNSGAKGDMPSFTINGTPVEDGSVINVAGGSVSPNEVVISTESDLYNVANADKIFLLQSDIALTANRALPSNVTLKGQGGKITGAFTLTGDNATIISDSKDETIIDCAEVIIDGTWKNNFYSGNWFGLVKHEDSPLYDNFTILHRSSHVVNSSGGIYEIQEGTYYQGLFELVSGRYSRSELDFFRIKNNVWLRGLGKDITTLAALPNDLDDYAIVYVWGNSEEDTYRIDSSKISDIHFRGETDTHIYDTEGGIQDRGSNVMVVGRADGFEMFNCRSSYAKADGLIWEAYVDLGTPSIGDSAFEYGSIDSLGNDIITNDYRRTIDTRPLTSASLLRGYIQVTGASYGNSKLQGTVADEVQVAFYDDLDNFIDMTNVVQSYKEIKLLPTYKKYRVIIPPYPLDSVFYPDRIKNTDEIVDNGTYEILTSGDTDWIALGAASNNVGTIFTATGDGSTGTGTAVVGTPLTAGSFVVGQPYQILTEGTTDFTLIGSKDNIVGTTFIATGVGVGTGVSVLNTPGFIVSVRAATYGVGSKIYNNVFEHNRRNHISNHAPNTEVYGNQFLELGASDPYWAGPGYAQGPEDGYGLLWGVNIHDNYFKNQIAGALNARFIKGVKFNNNHVDTNEGYLFDGTKLGQTTSIGVRDCNNGQISGGIFYNVNFRIGQGSKLSNIIQYGQTQIQVSGRNCVVSNVLTYNGGIRGEGAVEGVNYFNDIDLIVTKDDVSGLFQSLNQSHLKNIHVKFEQGIRGFDNFNRISRNFDDERPPLGSVDNLTMENVSVVDSFERGNRGLEFGAVPIKNSDITIGLFVTNGFNPSKPLKYFNNKTKWIDFTLNHYPTTGTTYYPIEIKEHLFSTDGDGSYMVGDMHFINTPLDVRVALRVENSVFNIDVAGKDLFIKLLHTGTVDFRNTRFVSVDAVNIELDTQIPTATTTFKNCEAVNVTFTKTGVPINIETGVVA